MGVALATTTGAAAIAIPPPPTTIENQEDRRPPNPLAEEARRSRAAVELFRSGDRNFVPDPGLAGGVVGGCAALAGWTAATRRRLRQPASAT